MVGDDEVFADWHVVDGKVAWVDDGGVGDEEAFARFRIVEGLAKLFFCFKAGVDNAGHFSVSSRRVVEVRAERWITLYPIRVCFKGRYQNINLDGAEVADRHSSYEIYYGLIYLFVFEGCP